ncbi:LOW QUALITY PROTEIN: sorting nexin-19 [Boleophthalmus pectinirostris]|uniref:LOW QUALITY PROTEIN: sorting nexin-19 n=1 Tax=Boleophthalmus pectinirostris TaxID=150288 RepID=UPI00242EA841|nr:LOW QUALITY PROTEIN: sorting nexin-19 [Boleophthalmus pectinirostris]
MAEVLGQKSLLGVCVLVAWLVLFHLLVNIWLLCVFTSLLLVLGGWLGSQAALDSNTVLHLERFITMEQISPSKEDEEKLDQEIHKTVRKIIRDFVTSWYSTVSTEKHFESDVHDAMIYMAMELKRRARQVDRKELTQRILDLFGCHLQDFLKTKQLVPQQQRSVKWDGERMWRAYSSTTPPHVAMTSKGLEINYMRAIVDLLLHVLVPSPHLETRSGRFVVGELITCNVMLPLIDKLSDPDWLNLLVIALFGKNSMQVDGIEENPTPPLPTIESEPSLIESTPEQLSIDTEAVTDKQVPSNVEMPTPEIPTYFKEDLDGVQNTEDDEPTQPFLRHFLRGSKSNPFYQETDSDLDSPLTDYQQSSLDSLVMIGQDEGMGDKQKEGAKNNGLDLEDVFSNDSLCPKVLVNSQPVENTNSCLILKATEGTTGNIQAMDKELVPPFNPSKELLLGVEQTGLTSPNELTVVSPSQITSPLATFSFEPLSSPEGPVIIQNLRITGTITAKEHRGTGSHPYTLYTIKYETAMGCENQESMQPISEEAEAQATSDSPTAVQQIAYHMVNRRYSEFLNLQTRLEERADLRKLIKGVKGPKKIFPDMPFGNMDSDKIEARKGLLETFLKQLCAIPEIANSEEMQEFLALNTDARIAFVKKPFITSRIDKIVVNAIVDTLKTAFPRSEPQSPTDDTDEPDGLRMATDKKNKSRLKFATKNVPFMNGSDVRPPPLFTVDQNGNVFNGMTLGDLEAFIYDREKLALRQDSYTADSPIATEITLSSNSETRSKSNEELVSETALAEVTLNILCLLMREQWSWLCTENIQRTIRLLFGTVLNRFLDVSVANLLCTRYWTMYLQVIQEAVWPGGTLPTAPEVVRTQQQKDDTKQEALQCLMQLLPDLISDMLGSDKYKLSWQNALDSLQDPYINRHLVYCIFDLLLEYLVPETSEEDFQRSLLQSLSKVPEKIQA